MTIYYNIHHPFPGETWVHFYTNHALAQWDADLVLEGWESTGSVEVDAPTDPFHYKTEEPVFSPLTYWANFRLDWDVFYSTENTKNFIETFFPDGLPRLEVEEGEIFDDGLEYLVFEEDRLVAVVKTSLEVEKVRRLLNGVEV